MCLFYIIWPTNRRNHSFISGLLNVCQNKSTDSPPPTGTINGITRRDETPLKIFPINMLSSTYLHYHLNSILLFICLQTFYPTFLSTFSVHTAISGFDMIENEGVGFMASLDSSFPIMRHSLSIRKSFNSHTIIEFANSSKFPFHEIK